MMFLNKKIDDRIVTLKHNNDLLSSFFDEIINYNPIIIGGFIRDVINEDKIRDIDIILNVDNNGEIDNIVNKYNLNYIKNQFDGYKLFLNDIVIDIWYINNHNLFEKRIYDVSVDNLKETTFINYDSLIYDINNNRLDIDYYLECINSSTIDFVGNDDAIKNNPSIDLSIVKIFNICYKNNMGISKRVNDYILSLYNLNKLKSEYERHYNFSMPSELDKYINNYYSGKSKRLIRNNC